MKPLCTWIITSNRLICPLLTLTESDASFFFCAVSAVASEKPVLLVGPVGSGKTTLVEHLATLTGRGKTPHLIKIQLGDQTDSKVCVPLYGCIVMVFNALQNKWTSNNLFSYFFHKIK